MRWADKVSSIYESFHKKDPGQAGIFCAEKREGRRRFCTALLTDFWVSYVKLPQEIRHFYEVIRPGEPCRLYLDVEFYRDVNPGIDGIEITKILVQFICNCLKVTFDMNCDDEDIVTLDSCTDVKFSKHLIFHMPKALFAGNDHIGRFLKMIAKEAWEILDKEDGHYAGLSSSALKNLFIRKRSGERSFLSDLGVYRRNQQFRLWKSSKLNSDAVLKVADKNRVFMFDELDINAFKATLVMVSPPSDVQLLRYTDEKEHTTETPARIPAKESSNGFEKASRFGGLDIFVKSYIREKQSDIVRRFVIKEYPNKLCIAYFPRGSNFCEKIKACHKKNQVYYVANLSQGVVYQKCCSCTEYRSLTRDIPRELYHTLDEEIELNELFAEPFGEMHV